MRTARQSHATPEAEPPSARRQAILDKALPLFLGLGFEGVSMSMIAAATGGSKGTLYNYFPTKADLFVALMEQTWAIFAQEPAPARRAETLDDVHRWLEAWVADYLRHLHDDDIVALHRLIIAEAARFTSLAERLYAAGPLKGLSVLAADLQVFADKGLLACPDARRAAQILRALAKSGSYEARLWGAAASPSSAAIKREAQDVAARFLAISASYRATTAPTFAPLTKNP